MIPPSDVAKLLAWLRKIYDDFEPDQEAWEQALAPMQPGNLRRGCTVLREMGFPPISLEVFTIACKGGERFLHAYLEREWAPSRRD